MAQGFVYVLVSPNSDYVKIGRTERPIIERLRGINGHEAYSEHGPWELSDFLHVTDCALVERQMHNHFRDRHIATVVGTNELFGVPPHEAREKLRTVDARLRVDHEKTEQLFAERDVQLYLFKLFQLSGLYGNLDIQGAWTLSLQPKTAGGRWFTLNVGSHEVAFSSRKPVDGLHHHTIVLDRLILEYPETVIWVGQHEGDVEVATYERAKRAVSVRFWESFAGAERFFALPGVRRALIAYWGEALADLREREAKSVYARYHSYDAVSQLMAYKRAREWPFGSAASKPAPASIT